MSWTLVRHKNGQEVPIRVSVLDAFRNGPKRGDRPAAPPPFRPKANTSAPKSPRYQATASTTNSYSNSAPEVWTEDEDRILFEMKTDSKPWKAILEALGDNHNSDSQVKARWKEIQGKPIGGAAAGGATEGKKTKEEEKKAKSEQKKAEGLAKAAAGKEAKEGKGGKKGILKNNHTNCATYQESDLKSVAAKYDRDKWLAVASRHFDRTGQRISPEMAKAMCGSKD